MLFKTDFNKEVLEALGWRNTPVPSDFEQTVCFVAKLMGDEVSDMFIEHYKEGIGYVDIAKIHKRSISEVEKSLKSVIEAIRNEYHDLVITGLSQFTSTMLISQGKALQRVIA